MTDFQKNMEKYAELIVKVGINLQKDQPFMIISEIAAADFVRIVARTAYLQGAKNVYVEWQDEQLEHLQFSLASEETFKTYPSWYGDARAELAEQGGAFLFLEAATPDYMNDADPAKIASLVKEKNKTLVKFRNYTRFNKVSWCIAAVPTVGWAQKVFPDKSPQHALADFWELVFKMNRIDQEDPIQAWNEHISRLDRIKQYLNEKRYKRLHYSAPGTKLTVELPEKHIWVAANSVNDQGTHFVPNLPTEEVFTSPLKEGTSGIVSSTKPLHYKGTVIDKFSLTFENGKVVKVSAESGEESLKNLLSQDEGAPYLGEVALVAHDSPISNTNLIYHNTLFDENASCHLAVGMAFPFCLEGGTEMGMEQLAAHGINGSMVHVDFMIGGPEMNIVAELPDGTQEALFIDGNWAIPVHD